MCHILPQKYCQIASLGESGSMVTVLKGSEELKLGLHFKNRQLEL